MAEVRPSAGWGVVHLMLRADRGAPGADDALAAIGRFTATDPQQVIAFSVLGARSCSSVVVYSLSSVSET